MKKMIGNFLVAATLAVGTLGTVQVQANETVFKYFLKAHDLNDFQQELAVELMKSGKALAAEVKKPKQQLKAFFADAVQQDQLDPETMMEAYKNWQSEVDGKVYSTVQAFVKLHAELTPEQREKIVETITKMKSN